MRRLNEAAGYVDEHGARPELINHYRTVARAMNEPKPWWKSKTIWVNVVVVLVAALTGAANSDAIREYPEVVALIGTLVGILNMLLRLVTRQPVQVKPNNT
jgi:hypothetical protein